MIRDTIADICDWLEWNPAAVERRAASRGQPLSRTQWVNYLTGRAKLSDNIARTIAAVFSLPDPATWTAEGLREALDSDWETILDRVLSAMLDDLASILRSKRGRRRNNG